MTSTVIFPQTAVAAPSKAIDVDVACNGSASIACHIVASYTDGTVINKEVREGDSAPQLPGITAGWYIRSLSTGNKDGITSGYHARVACRSDINESACLIAALTENPDTASVVQMPTAGAPNGLRTVSMVAVAVSIMGLTAMIIRRRS